MSRGNWEKLSLNHPPLAVVHTKFFTGTPPLRDLPIPPPHYQVPSIPPPRKNGATKNRKHKPTRLENNCTPVVDSRQHL